MAEAPTIPPVATATHEAMALLDQVGGVDLLAGLAAMEGVGEMTYPVLRGIGMGSSSGLRLLDCATAGEAASVRLIVAKELVGLDGRLMDDAEGDSDAARAKNAVMAVARLVAELVDAIRAKDKASAAGTGGTTSYVVSQTEEELGFTLTTFGDDEVKRQKGVLVQMYNINLTRGYLLPGLPALKRVAFWVKHEGCWPDPARVTLESMRREPHDSALLKFKRMAYAVLVVAAGEKVGPTTRHEGAGGSKKYCAQWANGDTVEELLGELSEAADRLTEAEVEAVVAVMHESMHKATSRGNESVSLAASKQICKVVDYVAQARMAAVHAQAAAVSNRSSGWGSSSGTTGGKTPPKSGKRGRGASSSTPEKAQPARKAPKNAAKSPSKWVDEEGAVGPNGLDRKKGGNSAGARCERLAKGECPFKTCSYSHA